MFTLDPTDMNSWEERFEPCNFRRNDGKWGLGGPETTFGSFQSPSKTHGFGPFLARTREGGVGKVLKNV